MIEIDEKLGYNKKFAVLITYNKNSENIFQNHFGKRFPKKFRILRSKILNF
jgi:hypothetical protein